MITKRQDELLNNIRKEFCKLNVSKITNHGLIDVDEILGSYRDGEEEIKEIQIANQQLQVLCTETFTYVKNILRDDLNSLGMRIIDTSPEGTVGRIVSNKGDNSLGSTSLRCDYNYTSKIINKKRVVTYTDIYVSINSYCNHPSGLTVEAPSIEDLMSDRSVIKLLKNMYSENNK